jgi:Fe-S-cluster containining protein
VVYLPHQIYLWSSLPSRTFDNAVVLERDYSTPFLYVPGTVVMTAADPEHDRGGCQQCGLCCKVFGDRITPTTINLYTWMVNQRTDILKFFSVRTSKGKVVPAVDFKPEDLGEVVSIELRVPETAEYPSVCPFLRRVSKNRYLCSIHEMKPDMCCNYMPWIFGETYFPKCIALKNRDNSLSQIIEEDEAGHHLPGSG